MSETTPSSGSRGSAEGGTRDMTGKTVLITGANQGIGKASAIALGKMGAHVVIMCRSEQKARDAIADMEKEGVKGVELIVVDFASQADIRRAAKDFEAKHDRLDVLLNNAGALVTKPLKTKDGLEQTFGVNHIGYFLLTKCLLGLLEKTADKTGKPSRVVNVASRAHRGAKRVRFEDIGFDRGYKFAAAYGQSKLCNILFTRELAKRVDPKKVTANSLHPGVIASGFGHTYGGLVSFLIRLGRPFLTTTEEGAKTQVYLCSSPEVEGVTGKYFAKCKEEQPTRAAQDDDAAKRLWKLSEEIVAKTERGGATASADAATA